MKSSLEIAQGAQLIPIDEIAERAGLQQDELEPYGRYKAKVSLSVLDRMHDVPDAKLVCVTGMTPTKAGEGKTTTLVGLAQGLGVIGESVVACLREASVGPVFGIKGGAAGGGLTQVVPMEDLNLHFTGDIHAIGAANNLLAAMIDASILHGNPHKIDALRVPWRRAVDMNDRVLRDIAIGLGGRPNGYPRETGFDITAASEVMAMMAVARDLRDLRRRLAAVTAAYSYDGGHPITAEDLQAAGAMTVLLKDALKPNLVQTLEGQLVLMHCGPFANIAHGNNSLIADLIAMKLGDYVHRVGLRLRHGDGEVLRHRLPLRRAVAGGGGARRNRPRRQAPRRRLRGRSPRSRRRPPRDRDRDGERPQAPRDHQELRGAGGGRGQPAAGGYHRGGRRAQAARARGGGVRRRDQ